jgi:CheY-like chemotaxis protein
MLTPLAKDVLKGWRVLVVDDEPDAIKICHYILKMYGAEALSATNGQEGIATALEQKPEVILSDIAMPVMNGYEMIGALKENPQTKTIPVIAITAHALVGDREKAISAGFTGYMAKPLQPKKFIHDLIGLLKQHPTTSQRLQDIAL